MKKISCRFSVIGFRLKRYLKTSFVIFVFVLILPLTVYRLPFTVYAQEDPCADCANLPSGYNVLMCPNCALFELAKLVGIVLKYGALFAIIASVVVILLGAFKYITAGDNPKAIESARGTLTWAIIGLVVATSAWGILKLIASAIPGLSEKLGFGP